MQSKLFYFSHADEIFSLNFTNGKPELFTFTLLSESRSVDSSSTSGSASFGASSNGSTPPATPADSFSSLLLGSKLGSKRNHFIFFKKKISLLIY